METVLERQTEKLFDNWTETRLRLLQLKSLLSAIVPQYYWLVSSGNSFDQYFYLDGLPPEEECRADIVTVHQEGRSDQLERLGDPLRIVDNLQSGKRMFTRMPCARLECLECAKCLSGHCETI